MKQIKEERAQPGRLKTRSKIKQTETQRTRNRETRNARKKTMQNKEWKKKSKERNSIEKEEKNRRTARKDDIILNCCGIVLCNPQPPLPLPPLPLMCRCAVSAAAHKGGEGGGGWEKGRREGRGLPTPTIRAKTAKYGKHCILRKTAQHFPFFITVKKTVLTHKTRTAPIFPTRRMCGLGASFRTIPCECCHRSSHTSYITMANAIHKRRARAPG